MVLSAETAYAELGLPAGASEAEVKAAWRRLVSQWHPDRNGSQSAVARMQRINQALEVIRSAGPGEATAAEEPTADHAAPLRTLHRKVRLTLEEAAAGCTRVLSGRFTETCAACTGAGFRVMGGPCVPCQGAGSVRQPGWYGLFGATEHRCEACRGSGLASQVCSACAGVGKLAPQPYRISVRIPHGARSGDLLHVADRVCRLDLRVEVEPHALFELDADGTLRCQLPVDGFLWIACRVVKVPTLQGLHGLPLRRGQLVYRLKGMGFPVERRGARGDLLVTVDPVFAERFSADQEILLDQLVASTPTPPAALTAWNDKLQRWQQGRGKRPRAAGAA